MPATEPEPRAESTLSGMILALERDAGDADAVVGRLRDRAGHVRAVAVVVVGVALLVTKFQPGTELGLRCRSWNLGDAGVDAPRR